MLKYYGTASAFAIYCSERDYDLPGTLDVDDTVAALIVASEFIDGRYRDAFSTRTLRTGGREQLREWPRAGFIDGSGYSIGNDVVPREVEQATYEAARRQIVSPGVLSTDFKLATAYKRVSIDGAISVDFAGASSASDAQIMIPIIDQILSPLINGYHGRAASGLSGAIVRV